MTSVWNNPPPFPRDAPDRIRYGGLPENGREGVKMKITKEAIKNALIRGNAIKMHATNMVGGAVSFWLEDSVSLPGSSIVRVTGIVNSTEDVGFDDVDDLVSYIYRERKRIIWYH